MFFSAFGRHVLVKVLVEGLAGSRPDGICFIVLDVNFYVVYNFCRRRGTIVATENFKDVSVIFRTISSMDGYVIFILASEGRY